MLQVTAPIRCHIKTNKVRKKTMIQQKRNTHVISKTILQHNTKNYHNSLVKRGAVSRQSWAHFFFAGDTTHPTPQYEMLTTVQNISTTRQLKQQ